LEAAARSERLRGAYPRLLAVLWVVPDQAGATGAIFTAEMSCNHPSKKRASAPPSGAAMPRGSKIALKPHAAAAAADFDWDAGREYHPCQLGHQFECDLPFDEEELDIIAAARCWMDYALCDCWAPLLLCNPKRSRAMQERPSFGAADRLRSWWEEYHEAEFPTVYAGPHPPDELFDLCLRRQLLDPFLAVVESVEDYEMCDGDFPDADGIYRPWSHTLRQSWQERHHFSPDLSEQDPEPPAAAPQLHIDAASRPFKRKRPSDAPHKLSVPRSSLLDRFMGLDPKLSYRTRILIVHWAAMQMSRADGHKSWNLSGFIPFDPAVVLEPLGVEIKKEQRGIKQSLRLQETQYLQDIQETVGSCQLPAEAKFLKIHDILMRALNADVWQRRSIFADKQRKQEVESESSSDCESVNSSASQSGESASTIPAYGAVGADIARRLEKKQVRDEQNLVKSKPFCCALCQKRYKTQRGLTQHIQQKHPSYPTNSANNNAIVLQQPDLQQPAGPPLAPMAAQAVAPAAAAAQRTCSICGKTGHRADNKKFHPNLPSA
jgi:endogenous inhibitor of DNA gyrase (YacG/DUF329 family)